MGSRSWKSMVMNMGSTLMKFGIFALFFCPLISCRYTESIITRDDCGIATLVSNNRLKINLSYSNNMNCFVQLIFSEVKNFLLTIENFKSESDFGAANKLYGADYFDILGLPSKGFQGDIGNVIYQWSGNFATFNWKTDGSITYQDMTAYVSF